MCTVGVHKSGIHGFGRWKVLVKVLWGRSAMIDMFWSMEIEVDDRDVLCVSSCSVCEVVCVICGKHVNGS